MVEGISQVKRPRILGAILSVGFITQLVIELLLTATFAFVDVTDGDAAVYLLQMCVGGLAIANFVLFLFWQWRTVRNTELFGIGGLSYSAGWSVGYWFIPIANLFLPYMALSELYRANQSPDKQRRRDSPIIIVLLWIAVMAQIPATVMMRLNANDMANIDIDLDTLHIALYASGALRAFCLLFLVIRIGAFQKRLKRAAPVAEVF